MNRPSFLDALNQRVLVCDGAMGTMLYGRGVFLNRCFDELNVTQPDLVEGIRAQLIDKDRNPKWQPATIAELGDDPGADARAFMPKHPLF